MFQRKKLPLERINLGHTARKGMAGYKNQEAFNKVPVAKGNSIPKASGKIGVIAPAKATHPTIRTTGPSAVKFKKINHPIKPTGSATKISKIMPRGRKPIAVNTRPNNPKPTRNAAPYAGK